MLPDLLLALKPLEVGHIRFHVGVRHLEDDDGAGPHIRSAQQRGHTCMREDAFDAVVIESVARIHGFQRGCGGPVGHAPRSLAEET